MSMAQKFDKVPLHKMDTVHVKGDRFVFIDDDAYYIKNDTVFLLPDTVEFHVRKNNLDRTDNFYQQIKSKMSKTRVSSLIYEFLFRSNEEGKPHAEASSGQRFTAYENEYIRKIKYKHLQVFGSDINDTTIYKSNRWTRPLNKIHIHTRSWVVKKNVLFKKGDKIDPDALINSERLLRRLNYIQDARVFIKDYPKQDHADVIVATKDVFPYNFQLNPGGKSLFGISNINIAGTGHELEYDYIRGGGSEFLYRIRNISHSFIDSEIDLSQHFEKRGYGLFLTREFFTQETKYAGGAIFSRYRFGEVTLDPTTELPYNFTYDRKHMDLWVGRSFGTSIESGFLRLKKNTRAVVSVKASAFNYFERPIVSADSNYRFHDNTTYLFNIGLTSRDYYKDKLILQFGRMEDIPTGSSMGIVLGHQQAEFRNRMYMGFNHSRGGYLANFGYLNAIFSIGSFINNNGISDGVVKVGTDYFTKLFTLNQFRYRQFFNFIAAKSINPSERIFLSSDSDLGIRGLSAVGISTSAKVAVKVESLFFTPSHFFGFRVGVFTFLDYAKIFQNDEFTRNNIDLLGIGGGLRLRNDNLAFSTLQLRVGYYPDTSIGNANWGISIATSTRLVIRDFDFKAPRIVSFR